MDVSPQSSLIQEMILEKSGMDITLYYQQVCNQVIATLCILCEKSVPREFPVIIIKKLLAH